MPIQQVMNNQLDKMHKKVMVNDTEVRALIDTGSPINIITENTYRKIGSPWLNEKCISLTGFAMGTTKIKGQCKCKIIVDDGCVKLAHHIKAQMLK